MRSVSAGRLVKAAAFGILGAVVAMILDAAISYLRKDWTNPVGIALVAGISALSGVVPLLQRERPSPASQLAAPPPAPQQAGAQPYGPPPYGAYPYDPAAPARPARKGLPLLIGVLVLLVFCGGGVAGVTYGAQYFGGWITGDERGFDVLAQQQSASSGPLKLTVQSVTLTSHFTKVALTADNAGTIPINLPLYENCQLTASGDRRTLGADSFRSDWNQSVPPNGTVYGTVVFPRLPDGAATVSISFSVIYGLSGPSGPASITVADIPLNAS